MAEQVVRQVVVTQLVGPGGRHTYRVESGGEMVVHTADVRPGSWQLVEQAVRAGFNQHTPAERLARVLHAIVEQHGTESPLGSECQAALITAGLD